MAATKLMNATELVKIYEALPAGAKKYIKNKIVGDLVKDDGALSSPKLGSLWNKSATTVDPVLDDKVVASRMKPYQKGLWKDVLYGVGSAAGDIIEGAGDVIGTRQSLLGDALSALSHVADSPGYVNPLNAAVAPISIGRKMSGYTAKKFGEVANTALHDVIDPLKKHRDLMRNAELLIRERPNTGFYNWERHEDYVGNQRR